MWPQFAMPFVALHFHHVMYDVVIHYVSHRLLYVGCAESCWRSFRFACITIHGSKRMLFILTESDILHFINLMCVQVLLENTFEPCTWRPRLGGPLLP